MVQDAAAGVEVLAVALLESILPHIPDEQQQDDVDAVMSEAATPTYHTAVQVKHRLTHWQPEPCKNSMGFGRHVYTVGIMWIGSDSCQPLIKPSTCAYHQVVPQGRHVSPCTRSTTPMLPPDHNQHCMGVSC